MSLSEIACGPVEPCKSGRVVRDPCGLRSLGVQAVFCQATASSSDHRFEALVAPVRSGPDCAQAFPARAPPTPASVLIAFQGVAGSCTDLPPLRDHRWRTVPTHCLGGAKPCLACIVQVIPDHRSVAQVHPSHSYGLIPVPGGQLVHAARVPSYADRAHHACSSRRCHRRPAVPSPTAR